MSHRSQNFSLGIWGWCDNKSNQLEKRAFEHPVLCGLVLIHGTPVVAASLVAVAIWLLSLPWYWVVVLVLLIVCGLWSPFFVASINGMKRAYPQEDKWKSLMVMLMGAMSFSVGAYWAGSTAFGLRDAMEVPVVVVGMEENDRGSYLPVFEVTPSDGARIRYADNFWIFLPLHEKGEVVTGRYSPSSGMISSTKLIKLHLISGLAFALFGGFQYIFGLFWSRR